MKAYDVEVLGLSEAWLKGERVSHLRLHMDECGRRESLLKRGRWAFPRESTSFLLNIVQCYFCLKKVRKHIKSKETYAYNMFSHLKAVFNSVFNGNSIYNFWNYR
jgi:hypothetical protein